MAPPKAEGGLPHGKKLRAESQYIQELILSGSACAGEPATIRQASEAIGIRETPIREAIPLLFA